MKFLCITVLICGVFVFVSAEDSSNSIITGVSDGLKNIEDQFTKGVEDFGSSVSNGISQLSASGNSIFGGLIKTVTQTISDVVNQVAKFFTDPIYSAMNKFADGIVKELNQTVSNIQKLQKCADAEEPKIDFTAPLTGVEKCAVNSVNQAGALVGKAVTAIGQLGTSIGQDVTDALGCVGSFFNIFNCLGSLMNGGLRGARDVSNTITVGSQVAAGFVALLPEGVLCLGEQFNEIVANATQIGLDTNKCLKN